ncbi:MAG: hypothetical protein PHH77_12960 [Victivallaceae bacterium]|nr:hypothetical protein [Victivallaceae bacterium]
MLEQSLAWLEAQRKIHLTVPVIYRHGSDSAEVPATVGKTVFKVIDDYGRFQHIESRDYLISAADLVLDNIRILPQPGDEIEENDFIYEVMAPNNEPEWRYSDSCRQILRIHTKLTGETDAERK